MKTQTSEANRDMLSHDINSVEILVVVGSLNPVKIKSAQLAVNEVYKGYRQVQVYGVDVPSHVAAQPMGDEETLSGAKNR